MLSSHVAVVVFATKGLLHVVQFVGTTVQLKQVVEQVRHLPFVNTAPLIQLEHTPDESHDRQSAVHGWHLPSTNECPGLHAVHTKSDEQAEHADGH